MTVPQKTSDTLFLGIRIALFALLLIVAAGAALLVWRGLARSERDVVYGVPPEIQTQGVLEGTGVNVDLARSSAAEIDLALEAAKRAGISWVRQPFPWAEMEPQKGQFNWEPWDRIVSACRRHQIPLVAVLKTSPPWAQRQADRDLPVAPPANLADFGNFAAAVAARYGPALRAYQIWDEPNIQPNWGHALVDPTGYMRLLREASIQIREVDPAATIALAGLAPTTEEGPVNLNEPQFLQGLYDSGARRYFDVVAAKPYGFWSGPDDRRTDPTVLNFSRVALLRQVMEANHDGQKPVWAVEMGWNALPPDWAGTSSPWGTDVEALQMKRTLDAIQRARIEWPWLTGLALAQLLPPEESKDPKAGLALLDRQGLPRQLYQALVGAAQSEPIAYPGHHASDDPAIHYEGGWRVRSEATDVGQKGDSAQVAFYGTRLDLEVRRGRYWGVLYVTVDDQPANGLPRDGEGRSYLVLHDPLEREANVLLASGLADGVHHVRLTADGGWEQWPILEFVAVRERSHLTAMMLLLACALGVVVGAVGLGYHLLAVPVERLWPAVLRAFWSVDERIQVGLVALLGLGIALSPPAPLRLACLGLLGLLACLRPVLGLALVVFAIPFFLTMLQLTGRSVNALELALILSLAGFAVHFGLNWWSQGKERPGLRIHRAMWKDRFLARLNSLDWTMMLLIVVGFLAVITAENFGVANREFRVLILESVIFYFLIRVAALRRSDIWLLTDALILAGIVVALIGLYQFGFTSDIISAEGVRRIKAVYASPNNLGLFLGRIVALLMGLIVALPISKRQGLYALSAIPILACLYLTYSRGSWLLGLPLAMVFVAVVRRGRALWGVAIALALLLLSLIPIASTGRISRLWSAGSGDGTAFLRIKLWQGTVQMIRDHPIFGVGLDNFLYQYRTRYILPEAWQEPNLSHPHNIVLDYWTRLGILGLGVLLWQQVAFFRMGLKTYWRLSEGPERALALGLLTSMVYALGHGLIDNSFFLVDLAFILAWALALTVKLSQMSRPVEEVA